MYATKSGWFRLEKTSWGFQNRTYLNFSWPWGNPGVAFCKIRYRGQWKLYVNNPRGIKAGGHPVNLKSRIAEECNFRYSYEKIIIKPSESSFVRFDGNCFFYYEFSVIQRYSKWINNVYGGSDVLRGPNFPLHTHDMQIRPSNIHAVHIAVTSKPFRQKLNLLKIDRVDF